MLDYLPTLDGVRGLAIIAVIVYHLNEDMVPGGFLGVDLFFVLSGYLITSILYNEKRKSGRIRYKDFFLRRIGRLLPALILCLCLSSLMWGVVSAQVPMLSAISSVLLYYSNFIPVQELGPLAHCWSLSVEEQFYIIWPLFVSLLVFPFPSKRSLSILLLLIVCATIFRSLVYASTQQVVLAHHMTISRIDQFSVGALFGLINIERPGRIPPQSSLVALGALLIIPIIFVAACLLCTVETVVLNPAVSLLITSMFGILIVLLARPLPKTAPERIFCWPPLKWIGQRSYGIYLYHFPLILFCRAMVGESSFVANCLFVATLLGVSQLSYVLVELPIRHKVREFLNTQPRAQAVQ